MHHQSSVIIDWKVKNRSLVFLLGAQNRHSFLVQFWFSMSMEIRVSWNTHTEKSRSPTAQVFSFERNNIFMMFIFLWWSNRIAQPDSSREIDESRNEKPKDKKNHKIKIKWCWLSHFYSFNSFVLMTNNEKRKNPFNREEKKLHEMLSLLDVRMNETADVISVCY